MSLFFTRIHLKQFTIESKNFQAVCLTGWEGGMIAHCCLKNHGSEWAVYFACRTHCSAMWRITWRHIWRVTLTGRNVRPMLKLFVSRWDFLENTNRYSVISAQSVPAVRISASLLNFVYFATTVDQRHRSFSAEMEIERRKQERQKREVKIVGEARQLGKFGFVDVRRKQSWNRTRVLLFWSMENWTLRSGEVAQWAWPVSLVSLVKAAVVARNVFNTITGHKRKSICIDAKVSTLVLDRDAQLQMKINRGKIFSAKGFPVAPHHILLFLSTSCKNCRTQCTDNGTTGNILDTVDLDFDEFSVW